MMRTTGALNAASVDDNENFIAITPLIMMAKAMASARDCPVRRRRMKLYVSGDAGKEAY